MLDPKILICDDSSFARTQLQRALPAAWDSCLTFAADGREGLAAIRAGRGELVFLDLNMPGMDGYAVLEALQHEQHSSRVIVVSGDIQPEAQERVRRLGAIDFIKKPVDPDRIGVILERLGLFSGPPIQSQVKPIKADLMDGLREVANVAIGRAADLLARLLEVFVVLPVPRVNLLESGELQMALDDAAGNDDVSALCQGFVGGGIAGEALLLLHESSFVDLAALLSFGEILDEQTRAEILLDTASLLTGACLSAFGEQLDLGLSQGHPVLLGRHVAFPELARSKAARWKRVLAIELELNIEHHNISANLLLLFTGASLPALEKRMAYRAA